MTSTEVNDLMTVLGQINEILIEIEGLVYIILVIGAVILITMLFYKLLKKFM